MSTAAIKLDFSFPPDAKEKAIKELRETPDVVGPAIEELRKLVENDETLNYKTTDEILIRYLRPKKYYVQSAYDLIKREAAFKDKYRKILENLMPEDMADVVDEAPVNVLINRDQFGRRILIQHAGQVWNTKRITTDHVFRMIYLIQQAALLEEQTQVHGVVVIMDFKGMGLKQAGSLTPSFAYLLITFIQSILALRLKGVHIVNEPFIFKTVWPMFNALLDDKLKSRLKFHGNNFKKLHEFISPECLPEDYGGNLPKIDYSAKDWYPILRSIESTIAENNKMGLASSSKKK